MTPEKQTHPIKRLCEFAVKEYSDIGSSYERGVKFMAEQVIKLIKELEKE